MFERFSRTSDFGEDFPGGFGPDEGLWIGIVVFQVVVNGGFELGNGGEDAAPDALLSDQPEEALDLIEPGGRGGGEVQVKAGVLGQPCLDVGMLVGGVVVEDEVEIEFLRRLPIDRPQEAQELVVAVALHALSDHRAGGDIERGKQGSGAMALVVVRHGAGPASA